jgi:hypothetical protein
MRVIRVPEPVESKGERVQTRVEREDLQALQTAESVVGEVQRVKQLHVRYALASIN